MKKVLSIVSLIVIITLGFPKIIGLNLVPDLKEIAAHINSSEDQTGYSVRIKSLESGWFSSTIDMYIEYDPYLATGLDLFNDVFGTNVAITFQHGPFLTLNKWSLGRLAFRAELDKSLGRDILDYPDTESLYSLEGHINLSGAANVIDSMPALTSFDKTFKVGGWSGQWLFTSNRTTFQGEFHSLGLDIDDAKVRIKPAQLSIAYDGSFSKIFSEFMTDSSAEIIFGYIRAENPSINEIVEVKNLVVGVYTETSDDNRLINVGLDFSAGHVTGDSRVDILDYDVRDLIFKTEMKNLDKKTLEKLILLGEYDLWPYEIDDFLPFFKASPEFNIVEISGITTKGKVSGQMDAKLAGINSLPNDLENPAFWLSKVLIDSTLVFDKKFLSWVLSWAALFNPTLASIEDETWNGLFRENTDGKSEINFKIKDSEATLNGILVPLPL